MTLLSTALLWGRIGFVRSLWRICWVAFLAWLAAGMLAGCTAPAEASRRPLFDTDALFDAGFDPDTDINPDLKVLAEKYHVVTIPGRPHYLGFDEAGVGDSDLAWAMPYLERMDVRELNLSGQGITDEGVALLRRIGTLRVVHLQGTGVTVEGIRSLRGHPRLRQIWIGRGLDDGQLRVLRRGLPGVEIGEDARYSWG